MSKQWGHGFHTGRSKGQGEGAVVTAVLGLVVWGVSEIVKKSGLLDKK